jgi:hypothetical protein
MGIIAVIKSCKSESDTLKRKLFALPRLEADLSVTLAPGPLLILPIFSWGEEGTIFHLAGSIQLVAWPENLDSGVRYRDRMESFFVELLIKNQDSFA